jgi:uncharacterized protein YigA (DUF484 family)
MTEEARTRPAAAPAGEQIGEQIGEARVARYLAGHPDFFARHDDLLQDLRLPHVSGRAVSLFERQVELLRGEAEHHRAQIRHLLAVAAENERLTDRLHQLTLALIDAADFNEVLNTLEDHLHEQFRAEAVELRLLSELAPADDAATATLFRELFRNGRPVCGPLAEEPMALLFGGQAGDLHSVALLPLGAGELRGVLAIGSADRQRFHPGMGTDFLSRLGEIVAMKLQAVTLPGA